MGTRALHHCLCTVLAGGLVMMAGGVRAAGDVVVIGNPNLSGIDLPTLEKIYTGKVIEVNGVTVTAVNASSGSALRNRFLQAYLNQDDDKYSGYWIVRRYIGKGAPPREFSGSAAIINFVNATPGAIGYIEAKDVQPNLNVLLK